MPWHTNERDVRSTAGQQHSLLQSWWAACDWERYIFCFVTPGLMPNKSTMITGFQLQKWGICVLHYKNHPRLSLRCKLSVNCKCQIYMSGKQRSGATYIRKWASAEQEDGAPCCFGVIHTYKEERSFVASAHPNLCRCFRVSIYLHLHKIHPSWLKCLHCPSFTKLRLPQPSLRLPLSCRSLVSFSVVQFRYKSCSLFRLPLLLSSDRAANVALPLSRALDFLRNSWNSSQKPALKRIQTQWRRRVVDFFQSLYFIFSIRLFRNINQPLATLVSCLIVDSHIIAVGTYSRYAKGYVFCCSVADRFDFQCDSIFLCVADNVQVMVMWQQHWRMRSIPAEPHWACALQFCRSLASNSPAHVLQWRGLSLSNT